MKGFRNIDPSLDKEVLTAEIMRYYGVKDTTGKRTTVKQALADIKHGTFKQRITALRNENNPKTKAALKISLPADTFTGTFDPNRKKHFLELHSGLAIMDFDKCDPLSTKKYCMGKYALAAWTSPSGNGVKALWRIPIITNDEVYKRHYKALLNLLPNASADSRTNDVSRLCFVSYDPQISWNPKAPVFVDKTAPKRRNPTQPTINHQGLNPDKTAEVIIKWWGEKGYFKKGNRSNSIYYLAKTLNEFGVPKSITLDYAQQYNEPDFTENEIIKCVDSGYRSTQHGIKIMEAWK